MSILGINNRTENWETARQFAPILLDGCARVQLARKLGEYLGTSRADVDLELFWKGMRDYKYQTKINDEELLKQCAEAYSNGSFQNLCGRIKNFNDVNNQNPSRSLMMAKNYDVLDCDKQKDLLNNLLNTEIDIVLETPRHFYVGEAKKESSFGATGGYVLVHQLIREYVMASVLLNLKGISKKVVPFLVVDEKKRASVMRHGQVRFMMRQGWLKEANVLTWAYIERLRS